MRPKNRKFKSFILHALIWGGVDRFFRFLNNNKLLVVMYHGITENHYDPPVWTQLPIEIFKAQLEYLDRHYRIVTLVDVIAAVRGEKSLPQNAALITFDDGLKNNFSVAFPILKKMGLPAAIFLTVDYIATRKLLWFDELYLLIKQAAERGIKLPLPCGKPQERLKGGKLSDSSVGYIETLKHEGKEYRLEVMEKLRATFPFDNERWLADFGLLDWDDIRDMQRSGLMDFGVHTSSHCILSELSENEWESEIVTPKKMLESLLGTEISTFCFPNGRQYIDFMPEHIEYLRCAGYTCAFSTENALFSFTDSEPMAIGRIPAGNDFTSQPAYFRLNTSGAIQFTKWVLKRGRHAT
jgi:peptidoglycan/xylan/chitin deacetylase (PgdA/CDA1 family)